VLGAQHSDFAGADGARSGQSEDVTLLPSGRREAEEPLTVAVVRHRLTQCDPLHGARRFGSTDLGQRL